MYGATSGIVLLFALVIFMAMIAIGLVTMVFVAVGNVWNRWRARRAVSEQGRGCRNCSCLAGKPEGSPAHLDYARDVDR